MPSNLFTSTKKPLNTRFKVFGMLLIAASSTVLMSACSNTLESAKAVIEEPAEEKTSGLDIAFEQYELENGLKIILHVDKSDPIVAMATVVHVGSNREKPGRTGFAHFFEHMSFNDSENVPKGANRKMIPELGGTRNGGTWSDGTIYYEVVPKDAFDKLLWIDSDRLGYMINTVDRGTLEREKQVVKNEKRQRVDNRAYGHTGHVVKKALYPKDHPYNWTVIGDLEDLQAATLDDVREFYDRYYVPSNATLVIAGDIDITETKAKVERWFGEIKKGEKIDPIAPWHVSLEQDIKLYHIDNFAKLPEIRLTFPTVQQYHKDAYALDMLGRMLASGKNSPMFEVLVENEKLAPSVNAFHRAEEVTGTFTLLVRANAGTELDSVQTAIDSALAQFEADGFTDNQLTKFKAQAETGFYYQIESILDKALQLGIYNEYAGSPSFIQEDLNNILAVTREDIMRVYNTYIKDQPAIITSFVPKDGEALIVSGSSKAKVVEEQIVQGAEEKFEENDAITYTKTPSKFDRSEPPLSELPGLSVPDVWQSAMPNGMTVYGIEQNELPLVSFSLDIPGGQAFDSKNKLGTAVLLAQMMSEGTLNKSAQEIEEALGLLGASVNIRANKETLSINGSTLTKNFPQTVNLIQEMLLSPRWDQAAFERLKSTRLTRIKQGQGNPNTIASQAFMKILYGTDHLAGMPTGGTEETVANITLDDLKTYYGNFVSPADANFHIVGSLSQSKTTAALASLQKWQGNSIKLPSQAKISPIEKPQVYFIDVPNAKQSVVYIGKVSVAGDSDSAYPIQFANMRLGGGISARLAQTLRIQKGYTYGAYSYLATAGYESPFIASSQVRTNVTLESLEVFKDLIGNYQATFTQEDLDVAKNMTIKGNSRRFETLNSLLGMLQNISKYKRETNYIEQQQDFVINADLAQVHSTIGTYINEQQMIYLVVGDANTQLERMKDFGYGEPILLDIKGNKI